MMRRRVLGRVLAVLLLAVAGGPSDAAQVSLSSLEAAPNPRLGLAFPGSLTRHYPLIARAGIGVARLSVSWGRVEPIRGRFDWTGLDSRIAALQANGIEPFLTFESDADWATARESQRVKNARPVDLSDWSRFVRAVAERYDGDGLDDMPGLAGGVRYWQAANEWISDRNRSGGWVGRADELVAYIQTAYDAVKAEDPEAVFVLGGIASSNSDVLLVALGGREMEVRQSWSPTSETVLTVEDIRGPEITDIIERRVIPVLENSPYDAASVHLYGPEDRDPSRIGFMREVTGRPVLSSECGGPSLDYGGRYTPEGHFRAVVERNLGVLAAGAEFCLWFLLGEDDASTYGNRRTALYTRSAEAKPGVFAYRMLSRLIDPATEVSRTGTEGFALRRGDGGAVWVGWNAGAESARRSSETAGGETLCLADASSGTLATDAGRCAPDALVLGGPRVRSLFLP
ncbi:MAG: beta-galactosidase [Pseudomonadota bacterium]